MPHHHPLLSSLPALPWSQVTRKRPFTCSTVFSSSCTHQPAQALTGIRDGDSMRGGPLIHPPTHLDALVRPPNLHIHSSTHPPDLDTHPPTLTHSSTTVQASMAAFRLPVWPTMSALAKLQRTCGHRGRWWEVVGL